MLGRTLPTCGFVHITSLFVNESMDTALVADHDDLVVFASLFDLVGIVNLARLDFFDAVLVVTVLVTIFDDSALVAADAVVFVVLKQGDGEKIGALEDGSHEVSVFDILSISIPRGAATTPVTLCEVSRHSSKSQSSVSSSSP